MPLTYFVEEIWNTTNDTYNAFDYPACYYALLILAKGLSGWMGHEGQVEECTSKQCLLL